MGNFILIIFSDRNDANKDVEAIKDKVEEVSVVGSVIPKLLYLDLESFVNFLRKKQGLGFDLSMK